MTHSQPLVVLVFKAVALAMSVASIVLGILDTISMHTTLLLLGIGLFALSVAFLSPPQER